MGKGEASLYQLELVEVLFRDLPTKLNGIDSIIFDSMGTLRDPNTDSLYEGVQLRLLDLARVAEEKCVSLGVATGGPPKELRDIVNALLGKDQYFSNVSRSGFETRDGKLMLMEFPKIRSKNTRFFGVHSGGGFFAFFDNDGIYNELCLFSPDYVKEIDGLLNYVCGDATLARVIKNHRTPYPKGYIVVTLPADSEEDLEDIRSRFERKVSTYATKLKFRVSMSQRNRRGYVGPKESVSGRELNKRTGLEEGLSYVSEVAPDYELGRFVPVADGIRSRSERVMLEGAVLGVNITNNGINDIRPRGTNPPIINIRSGMLAVEVLRHYLALRAYPNEYREKLYSKMLSSNGGVKQEDIGQLIGQLPLDVQQHCLKMMRTSGYSLVGNDMPSLAIVHMFSELAQQRVTAERELRV